MTPLVTVVLPTFKRPGYLREALESLIAQTFQDFVVVVADDGDDDATLAVVRGINDPRITHRRNERNAGMLENNVSAFRAATTKYVANLHDDDRWRADLLERLVAPLEADESLIAAFSDHHVMDADGRVDDDASAEYSRYWKRDQLRTGVYRPFHEIALVRRSTALAIAGVMRRTAMDWHDFPDEVSTVYDLWLSYLASRDGAGAYYDAERLAYYRQHANTETATGKLRVSAAGMFVYQRFLDDPRLAEHRAAFRRQYAESAYSYGITMLRDGHRREARRTVARGLQRRPTLRGAVMFALAMVPWRIPV
jgi:glycosyltransferase involved in cell wall biosynthesis